jgi:hypothetical protein
MAQPETFSYGPHELQKIHVWKAEDSPQDKDLLWVMYVSERLLESRVHPLSYPKLTIILQIHPWRGMER